MPRCLLVYFSQGGATARIAERIAAGLRESGYEVALHNLHRSPQPPDPLAYDLLGVGTPVYYFRMPFNVTDYLRALPDLAGLLTFAFVTYGSYQGGGGTSIRRALRSRGGREVGYVCLHGEDHFLPYLKRGYLFDPGHPTERELDESETFGREIAARAEGSTYSVPADVPQVGWVYRFERLATSRPLARQFYSRMFRIDRATCNGCGLCARLCPTRNIAADSTGRPAWGRDCLLCLTCEMKCPKDAITSPLSWPLFLPFMMYNVYHASRDPSLSHVRVTHRRGKTTVHEHG